MINKYIIICITLVGIFICRHGSMFRSSSIFSNVVDVDIGVDL